MKTNNYSNTPKCRNSFALIGILVLFLIASTCQLSFATPPSLIWKKASDIMIYNTPALGDDGNFYAAAYLTKDSYKTRGLTAIDSTSGEKIWGPFYPPGCTSVYSSASVSVAGTVLVNSDWNECGDGRLTAFSPLDGQIIWDHGTSNTGYSPHTRGTPAINDNLNTTYFGSSYLYSVDIDSGGDNWVKSGGYYIGGAIFIDAENNIYYSSNNGSGLDSRIRSFNSNGIFRWEKIFYDKNVSISCVLSDNRIVINNKTDSKTIVNDKNGNELWSVNESLDRVVESKDGSIYASYYFSNFIVSYDSNGNQRWKVEFPNTERVSVDFVSEENVVYARGDDNFYALNGLDGSIVWSFQADATLRSSSININGRIFLVDANANFYLFDTTVDYAHTAWPKAMGGNRRHTFKSNDILPITFDIETGLVAYYPLPLNG